MSVPMEYGRRAIGFWVNRTQADRKVLQIWGTIGLLLITTFGLVLPLHNAHLHLLKSVHTEKQRLLALTAMQTEWSRLAAAPRLPLLQGEVLRGAVDSSARTMLAPTSINTTLDGDRVRATISGVPLKRLLPWIDAMQRTQRLRIDTITIKPDPSRAIGTVAVELGLRGGEQ